MILHGNSLSPFVRKVLVFAAEKGVALTNKPGFGRKDPEFLALSPFGKIPAFEDEDYRLSDSTAIVHYLDAKYPDPVLIPQEARARGRAMWFDEFADTIMVAQLGPVFFQRVVAPLMGMPQDLSIADRAVADHWPRIADYLEGVIPDSGFLVEDRLTIADIAVASPFVNFDHAGIELDAGTHPRLAAWVEAIHARPSFAPIIVAERSVIKPS